MIFQGRGPCLAGECCKSRKPGFLLLMETSLSQKGSFIGIAKSGKRDRKLNKLTLFTIQEIYNIDIVF